MKPEISILMPAYNCEQFIADAIESVLHQSFSDFELIILDDGSTDNTLSIARGFQDPRVIVFENPHDPIATLNRGLSLLTGKYAARIDADDLIDPNKLAIQHTLMEEVPEIDVCGTWMQLFGKNVNLQISKTIAGWVQTPLLRMLQLNFMFNATSMCRTEWIRKHHFVYKNYLYAEDYMFWSEAAHIDAKFFIVAQPLYYYRIWKDQVSRKHQEKQRESSWEVKKQIISWLIEELAQPEITALYQHTQKLNEKGILSNLSFTQLFYNIFTETNPQFISKISDISNTNNSTSIF